MNSSKYTFLLDMHSALSQISIPVTQNDTARVLSIGLTDGGVPYTIADGCLAMMSIKRPTGTYIETFCPIKNNAYIEYDFRENIDTAIVEGIHECQVTLYSADNGILSNPKFTMIVHSRAVTSDDIKITDTDRDIIDRIVIAEAGRVNAESERVTAEESRVEAEKARETSTSEAIDKCNEAANTVLEMLKGSTLIVTLTDVSEFDEYNNATATASHSASEIKAHINGGGDAIVIFKDSRIPLKQIFETHGCVAIFSKASGLVTDMISIQDDKSTGILRIKITSRMLGAVSYEEEQTLTEGEKEQARKNIGIDGGGSGLPDVTVDDNGKTVMVVNGAWEIVDCPTGTQYDVQTFTLAVSSWYTDGDYVRCDIDYEYINTEADLIIDVSVAPNIDMMAEASRCGVFCSGQGDRALMFHAYETPQIPIDVLVRITKPQGLSYTVNEDDMSITIVEG